MKVIACPRKRRFLPAPNAPDSFAKPQADRDGHDPRSFARVVRLSKRAELACASGWRLWFWRRWAPKALARNQLESPPASARTRIVYIARMENRVRFARKTVTWCGAIRV